MSNGCCGAVTIFSTGARSTISPAYITDTPVASVERRARSWLTYRTATLVSVIRTRRSADIRAWVVTSRPVVGSSRIRTDGRQANASARATRCCCPPLS